MFELVALTLVAAVTTTFALDILRPTMKLMTRRRRGPTTTTVNGHEVEAHALR